MNVNHNWGLFATNEYGINAEKESNLILFCVENSNLFIVKPQSLLISPFINCYRAVMYSYERFFNFFIMSGELEYSTHYGSSVLKKRHLARFVQKVKENNLSLCISTRIYDKPLDYYCRKHCENYFLLVETRRSDSLIVLPFLDDENVVDLNHLYLKTKCYLDKGKFYIYSIFAKLLD
jgi:hypothetical protein